MIKKDVMLYIGWTLKIYSEIISKFLQLSHHMCLLSMLNVLVRLPEHFLPTGRIDVRAPRRGDLTNTRQLLLNRYIQD